MPSQGVSAGVRHSGDGLSVGTGRGGADRAGLPLRPLTFEGEEDGSLPLPAQTQGCGLAGGGQVLSCAGREEGRRDGH